MSISSVPFLTMKREELKRMQEDGQMLIWTLLQDWDMNKMTSEDFVWTETMKWHLFKTKLLEWERSMTKRGLKCKEFKLKSIWKMIKMLDLRTKLEILRIKLLKRELMDLVYEMKLKESELQLMTAKELIMKPLNEFEFTSMIFHSHD